MRLYSERLGPRRLDRELGDLGVCSRQQAPRWIRAGRVAVDGAVENRPAAARCLGGTRRGESWLEIVLREGRYRQVRRMCAAVGHGVRQLVRVRIGGLALGELPEGALRRLDAAETRRLCREG